MIRIAVDIVLLARKHVLLIKRENAPFKGRWCLPGGFVDAGETLIHAAKRELEEETGLNIALKEFGVFDDPKRDPRGRTISVAHGAKLKTKLTPKSGSDAKEAAWFPLNKLPKLGFDHKKILKQALMAL